MQTANKNRDLFMHSMHRSLCKNNT